MWTGTVLGGCITGLGLSTSWMWYLSPENLPILSKQSLKSSWTIDFDSSPFFAACCALEVGFELSPLIFSYYSEILSLFTFYQWRVTSCFNYMELCFHWFVSISDFKRCDSKVFYPFKMLSESCRSLDMGNIGRSSAVNMQVSAPVSIFIFTLHWSFSRTLR